MRLVLLPVARHFYKGAAPCRHQQAPLCPFTSHGEFLLVIYNTSTILTMLKLMGRHFIHHKWSEILSVFQAFPCTTQIALSWSRLLPALFLKKPRYPRPFEILTEAQ
jgi:hypothetical protein